MIRLVLASQSPARRRLLRRLGLRFSARPARLDEAAVARAVHEPSRLVRQLAILKARAVARPGEAVIGADQVLVCDGRVFGKPGTEAKARRQLAHFSGRDIELLTGVCVLEPSGRAHAFVHRTRMTFRRLQPAEIRDYVRRDQPLECAGSFKFESLGLGLFSQVKTDDPTAIEGLPCLRLAGLLHRLELFIS